MSILALGIAAIVMGILVVTGIVLALVLGAKREGKEVSPWAGILGGVTVAAGCALLALAGLAVAAGAFILWAFKDFKLF
jgi:hypothetical protein